MNLITNAAEAIAEKGTITLETYTKKGQVYIRINDTGIGIPQDQLDRIFEPTFSKKGERVKAAIGLFSSYLILQKHGGEIRVDSTLEKGSTFTITLPLSSH